MDMLAGGGTAFDLQAYSGSDNQAAKPIGRALSMEELFPVRHYEPPRDAAVSGTQLRHRLITPEVIAAIDVEEPRPSLMQRLLRRR